MKEREKGKGQREDKEANSSWVSSAGLRKDTVNLCDFIERLEIEEDQIVHDLVQSLSHQSGNDMLVKLKDHVVPLLLENIKSFIISDHHFESSATMTEDQLVKLLGVLLVNLHYLPKVRAELLWPSRTQYELLQNVFGNLRDFHGLKVNRCIERKTIEYVLPQFQLMAERVGHFCFILLSYQLNKTDEKDEDGVAKTDKKNEEYEVSKSIPF
ncbi:hypothetical protein FXO37_05764 [Capsicum annuum]|nr:hypothetical protein FXO37_05764 [Capsicum annuum]